MSSNECDDKGHSFPQISQLVPTSCKRCGLQLAKAYKEERDARVAQNVASYELIEDHRKISVVIDAAGFRVAPDLLGTVRLWCIECGRDSGYHHDSCKKATKKREDAPKPKLTLAKEIVLDLTQRAEGPPTKAPAIDDAQGVPFHTNSLQCGYRPGGER